jgi:serine/threonine protein kinase
MNQELTLTNLFFNDNFSTIYNTINPNIIAKKLRDKDGIYFRDLDFIRMTRNNIFLCSIYDDIPIGINDEYYIRMEKLNGYDLYDYVHYVDFGITVEMTLPIINDVLLGLIYLNSNGYIHCDIKPENIRITCDGNKLIDYDMVVSVDDDRKTIRGTSGYIAPEMFYNRSEEYYTDFTETSDMWSLGMTLYYIIFKENYYVEKFDEYKEIIFEFRMEELLIDVNDETFEFLLKKFLVFDNMLRLTAEEFYVKYGEIFYNPIHIHKDAE